MHTFQYSTQIFIILIYMHIIRFCKLSTKFMILLNKRSSALLLPFLNTAIKKKSLKRLRNMHYATVVFVRQTQHQMSADRKNNAIPSWCKTSLVCAIEKQTLVYFTSKGSHWISRDFSFTQRRISTNHASSRSSARWWSPRRNAGTAAAFASSRRCPCRARTAPSSASVSETFF